MRHSSVIIGSCTYFSYFIFYLPDQEGNGEPSRLNPFTPKSDLIDFTLSNARQFYSSKGDPLGVKGLKHKAVDHPWCKSL